MSLTNCFIHLMTILILKIQQKKKKIGLANLSICYTWKNSKSAYNKYNNNKFKISTSSWNDEFYLIQTFIIVLNILFKK